MAPVQAPVQAPVRARWATRAELTRRGAEYPDDLSKIKGIGDSYKHKLYRAGIYTWRQIVEADHAALRRATGANSSTDVEAWVTQARALIEKHGRGEATYGGPLPDDLMKILGIGPVNSATLYRAGVCTYEQLAMMPIADLSALFPVAVAGDQPGEFGNPGRLEGSGGRRSADCALNGGDPQGSSFWAIAWGRFHQASVVPVSVLDRVCQL